MHDVLLAAGVLQLASAALLGWVLALWKANPDMLRDTFGVKAPRRVMQLHLDQVMMGLIELAVATAFPALPDWIAAVLLVGTVLNPLLFAPLAFFPSWEDRLAYRAVSVGSFLTATVGFVGLAVWVLFFR